MTAKAPLAIWAVIARNHLLRLSAVFQNRTADALKTWCLRRRQP